MPRATSDQYRAMFDAARAGGFAYPAVNVTSTETLNAALRGFADAQSDGIVQITTGAARYLAGPAEDIALGARAFAELAHVLLEASPVLIALHTDHCPPDQVDGFLRPLLRESRRRRLAGRPPLFDSHMFDGSQLPLEENLARAADLLEHAKDIDVLLEVEIGVVGGEEDGLDNSQVPRERLYTTPADALAVAERLGVGANGRYLLAATFGNVHGHYAPGRVRLRPDLLGELQDALRRRLPDSPGFDFVFHGGSGSTPEEMRAAISNGVVKVNVDTDMQYAFSSAVADHLRDATRASAASAGEIDKKIYDPRAWGRRGESAMAARVVAACRTLGSLGRTLTARSPTKQDLNVA
jgi:fructose-bisphosphate aldolase class II